MVDIENLKLYCASLINYKGNIFTNQTTHIIARNEEEAFKKACKTFEKIHKNQNVKAYISCIDLSNVDGHKIKVD